MQAARGLCILIEKGLVKSSIVHALSVGRMKGTRFFYFIPSLSHCNLVYNQFSTNRFESCRPSNIMLLSTEVFKNMFFENIFLFIFIYF